MALSNGHLLAQLKYPVRSSISITGNTAKQYPLTAAAHNLQYNDPVNAFTTFKKSPEEKKKHYILRGILIGGAIGIAPVAFGEGGAYVAVFSFPAGLITGAILGASAKRRHRND